jgi:heme/copper-type cytochrome/quinol oxidase subunit 2
MNIDIEVIETNLKKNFLVIVFIVSALLHIGEGSLTAVSYAESILIGNISTFKYIMTWIVAFIVFVGVASVSFTCAIAIPSSFKNISNAQKTGKGLLQSILFLVAVFGCYVGMQYFFLYVNLLLSNAIDSNSALQSINVINFKLNQVQGERVVTIEQAHGATIEVLIVYVNLSFEIMLSCAFAFLDVQGGNKPKK